MGCADFVNDEPWGGRQVDCVSSGGCVTCPGKDRPYSVDWSGVDGREQSFWSHVVFASRTRAGALGVSVVKCS